MPKALRSESPLRYFNRIAEGIGVSGALPELVSPVVQRRPEPMPMKVRVRGKLRTYCDGSPPGQRIAGLAAELDGELHYSSPERVMCHALLGEAIERIGWGVLNRAVIRIMPPRCRMKAHRDYLPRNIRRYHLALQADQESHFVIVGEGSHPRERCVFRTGELWQVDIGSRRHYVANDSDLPRAMLMIDMRDPDQAADFETTIYAPAASLRRL